MVPREQKLRPQSAPLIVAGIATVLLEHSSGNLALAATILWALIAIAVDNATGGRLAVVIASVALAVVIAAVAFRMHIVAAKRRNTEDQHAPM